MNSKTTFFRILITYVTVLAIPMIFGIVAYGTSYRTVAANYEISRQALLQQAFVHIDGNINIADTVANGVIFDPKVRAFSQIEEPFEGKTLYKVIENMKTLDKFMIGDTVIRDYYVIYDNGAVLARGRAFHLERFYPGQFEIAGLDFSEWTDLIKRNAGGTGLQGGHDIFIDGLPEDIITYVKPLSENSERQSVLLLLLNNRNFTNVFKEFPLEEEGWVAMLDSRGKIISSYPPENRHLSLLSGELLLGYPEEYESEDTVFTLNYAHRTNRGWFLVSAMPKGVVSQEVIRVRNVIAICLLLTILLGGGFVGFIAVRTFKPVRLIMDDNSLLKNALEAQKPFLDQAFLGRLIRGEFNRGMDIALYLEQTGIELTGSSFTVVLVHLEQDTAPFSVAIREQLLFHDIIQQKSSGHRVYVRPRDIYGLTLLFVHPGTDREANELVIEESISRWNRIAQSGISSRRIWGIGGAVEQPLEISRSHEEAVLALNYGRTHASSEPVLYSSLPRGTEESYRFLHLEARLRNMVSGGFKEELSGFLDELEERFINTVVPGSASSRAMSGDLFATVMILLNTNLIRNDEELEKVRANLAEADLNQPAQCCFVCRKALMMMTERAREQKRSHNAPLIDRIGSFINENYSRKDLNLAVVSEQFGITETYLSHFFKEQKGLNFSIYLKDLRMEMAKELLKKGKHPVGEVADLIGYGSYTTFARVFKQENGISAGGYREQLKSQ